MILKLRFQRPLHQLLLQLMQQTLLTQNLLRIVTALQQLINQRVLLRLPRNLPPLEYAPHPIQPIHQRHHRFARREGSIVTSLPCG